MRLQILVSAFSFMLFLILKHKSPRPELVEWTGAFLKFLFSLIRRWRKIYFACLWGYVVYIKRVYDHIHNHKHTHHNNETNDTPDHMLFSLSPLFFIFLIAHKLHDSINKVDHGKSKQKQNQGIYDQIVYLGKKLIKRLISGSICNINKE